MKTPPIIEDLDVPHNVPRGVFPTRINGAMNTLVLQGPKERLGQSIIEADSGPAQRLPQVEFDDFLENSALVYSQPRSEWKMQSLARMWLREAMVMESMTSSVR
jgi:hypothetical protein